MHRCAFLLGRNPLLQQPHDIHLQARFHLSLPRCRKCGDESATPRVDICSILQEHIYHIRVARRMRRLATRFQIRLLGCLGLL